MAQPSTAETAIECVQRANRTTRQTVAEAKRLYRSEGQQAAADAISEGVLELNRILNLANALPEDSPRVMTYTAASVVTALSRLAAVPSVVGVFGNYTTRQALRANERWTNLRRKTTPPIVDGEHSERRAAMAYVLRLVERLRKVGHKLAG